MMKKEALKAGILNALHGVDPKTATPQQLHQALGETVMEAIAPDWKKSMDAHEHSRRACYFSMEFLVGRAVYNNLLVLDVMQEAEEAFAELGVSLSDLEVIEDAALGNGGLGRLAACFLDSAATLDLPLDGYGIRYKYGLFKQYFEDGCQKEVPDDWMRYGDAWSARREEDAVLVEFAGQTVRAVPYDMPVIGCKTKHIGNLRLWQAEPVHTFDFDLFNQQKYLEAAAETVYAEDISRVLYPNDDTWEGKKLRLKQQYFFCAASLQDILKKHKAAYGTLDNLADKLAIQLNDTHPVISVPELVRQLMLPENGYTFEQAFGMARQIFHYTNHTVMPEALEKWDCNLVQQLLPAVYDIILRIEEQFMTEMYQKGVDKAQANRMKLVQNGMVHMARIAVYASAHTNGVAAIHTEILKDSVLKDWYQVYPERFQNKTNGITQRRWLALCNPELSGLLTELLGSDDWKIHLDDLKQLECYADDTAVLERFLAIKQTKKEQLAAYIAEKEGVQIDPQSIFDIQIKRLHEYKRQLLNVLHIVHLYNQLRDNPNMEFTPQTFLFGAKAAPGYHVAKRIIQLINSLSAQINADPICKDKLQVVFLENYRVSLAEKLMPASELSEQISTAGKEASGTGNMKFMMNGALTIGTMDGANVEICEAVGKENIFIFGMETPEAEALAASGSYEPMVIYQNDPVIRRVLDQMIHGFGDGVDYTDIANLLLHGGNGGPADRYMSLKDFASYAEAQERVSQTYRDQDQWNRMALINIANSGRFAADRSIAEYAQNIWRVKTNFAF